MSPGTDAVTPRRLHLLTLLLMVGVGLDLLISVVLGLVVIQARNDASQAHLLKVAAYEACLAANQQKAADLARWGAVLRLIEGKHPTAQTEAFVAGVRAANRTVDAPADCGRISPYQASIPVPLGDCGVFQPDCRPAAAVRPVPIRVKTVGHTVTHAHPAERPGPVRGGGGGAGHSGGGHLPVLPGHPVRVGMAGGGRVGADRNGGHHHGPRGLECHGRCHTNPPAGAGRPARSSGAGRGRHPGGDRLMLGPDPSRSPFEYMNFGTPNYQAQGSVIAFSAFKYMAVPWLGEFIADMNTLLGVPI